METSIRELTSADQPFLWEMLFQSLHVRPGEEPFERSILKTPELARYVENWGRSDDLGFLAEDSANRPVGAAWMRLFTDDARGYGFVDIATPELGMAVVPEVRSQGIGTRLLSRLLSAADEVYERVSLSVDTSNVALRLYERSGFIPVSETNGFMVMQRSRPLI